MKTPTIQRIERVCFDEKPVVLHANVHPTLPVAAGVPERIDYEYERKGTTNLFFLVEPLRGWRQVTVTAQRTKQDYARADALARGCGLSQGRVCARRAG